MGEMISFDGAFLSQNTTPHYVLTFYFPSTSSVLRFALSKLADPITYCTRHRAEYFAVLKRCCAPKQRKDGSGSKLWNWIARRTREKAPAASTPSEVDLRPADDCGPHGLCALFSFSCSLCRFRYMARVQSSVDKNNKKLSVVTASGVSILLKRGNRDFAPWKSHGAFQMPNCL